MKNLIIIVLLLVIAVLVNMVYTNREVSRLRCDVARGFFAERQYIYPILKAQGSNPAEVGKGIDNPITSDSCK